MIPRLCHLLLLSLLASAALPAADLILYGTSIAPGTTQAVSWTAQGYSRSARIHVPTGFTGATAIPLVLVLHGGGGTSAAIETSSGWSATADSAGWLAVYPQGLSLDDRGVDDPAHELAYWANDRGTRPDLFGIDDVGVISALVDALAGATPVDADRVYAMGMSNGAMMMHRLGRDSPGRWAALCSVSGSYTAEPSVSPFAPAFPVSLFIIHGTSDTIVPYAGGAVTGQGGPVIGAEATRDLWLQADGITATAVASDLPDTLSDGCTSQRFDYAPGQAGTRVSFIRVDGGNHSWPGGSGATGAGAGSKTDDFSATALAQAFFAGLHRQPEAALSRGDLALAAGSGETVTGMVIGGASDLVYTIADLGSGRLECAGLTVTASTGCTATVITAPTTVVAGATGTATVRVTPTASAWSMTATLASNDADESAYAVSAAGTAAAAPGGGTGSTGSTGDDGGGGGGCGLGSIGALLAWTMLLSCTRLSAGRRSPRRTQRDRHHLLIAGAAHDHHPTGRRHR